MSRRTFLMGTAASIGTGLLLPGCGGSSNPTPENDIEMGFAVGDTFFGLSEEDLQTRMDIAADLGARMLRLDFSMYQVRNDGPDVEQYKWDKLDHIIAETDKRNLSILGLLSYTADWTRDPLATTAQEGHAAPRDNDDFVDFARMAATRYPQIDKWEIWNEPNLNNAWEHPDPEAYARLFVPTAAALHEVNPNNLVATAGLGITETDGTNIEALEFLRRFLATEPTGIDAIGIHPYTSPLLPSDIDDWSPWQKIEGDPKLPNVPTVLGLLEEHRLDLPLWITEYGAPTNGIGDNVVTEAQQAAMIKEALLWRFERARVPVRLVFNPSDGYVDPSNSAEVNDPENYFGVTYLDNTLKPSAEAFKIAANS